jgi:16S rRNA (cytidine1402-2'-O)-methyltransferase
LFVVATPIGNMEDITFRAVRILGEVEAVACEDTRRTLKLLNRYGISKRLISYYQPQEGRRVPEILAMLGSGRDVALVSDAGTPGISDPGFPLIRKAIEAGIQVIPVPGPSAAVAALSAAGLPTHRFLFLGFIPPKKTGLEKMLASVALEPGTLVFYSPGRKIREFLKAVDGVLGDRRVVIARELTKVHEEFVRGGARELADRPEIARIKGEAAVLVEGLTRLKQARA